MNFYAFLRVQVEQAAEEGTHWSCQCVSSFHNSLQDLHEFFTRSLPNWSNTDAADTRTGLSWI